MDKIAAGLVFIPTKEIIDLCVGINERAFENGRGRFRLEREDYIPHISLAMGCFSRRHLDEVVTNLFYVINPQRSVSLEAKGVEIYKRDDGNRSFLEISTTDELRGLHEQSTNLLSHYHAPLDSASCLFEGEKTGMTDSTHKAITRFYELYGGEKYNPHITLGCYDADKLSQDISFPISFEASRFALVHLGGNCTARKVLFEAEFG